MEDFYKGSKTYTVQQIAKILNIPERTAYNFCNNTTEIKIKRIGKLIRINKDSFDKWLNS